MIKLITFFISLIIFSTFIFSHVIAKDDKQVVLVNPIRGSDFWSHNYPLTETPKKEYEIIKKNNFPATWLVRYDGLTNSDVQQFVKSLDSSQDSGLFFEITPSLTNAAGVKYNDTGNWHFAKSVLLTGYSPDDRKKMIDVAFSKFKEVTGKDPQILTPKKDEEFSDQQPLLKGTSSPNETVTITIHSQENIQTQVKADSHGVWAYRPTSLLSSGQHTISIVSKGSSGVLKTVTQSFTVYAQGSQVTQTATPSATPTGIITPTISATPTPTLAAPTPTPTAILIPSPIPSPVAPPATSKGGVQELPSPGNSIIPVGFMALGTTFVGIVLFLLTRGGSSL